MVGRARSCGKRRAMSARSNKSALCEAALQLRGGRPISASSTSDTAATSSRSTRLSVVLNPGTLMPKPADTSHAEQ